MSEVAEDTELEQEEHDSDEREMSFLEHLEELRWRLVKALFGVLAGVILCGVFADRLVDDVILRPSKSVTPPLQLINTVPFGQITFYMMTVIVAGFILSAPWILYQLWKFVEPGLKSSEKKYISSIVAATSFCFFSGIAFAYFIMLPYMLQFFATFGSPHIQNMIAVTEYMSFVVQLVLISGLIFELPMIAYFLARFGIMTPAFMRHYRRHAMVAILILAAIVTPTTDPVTMTVFAVPMFLLYELSIWIAAVAARKRATIHPDIA